MLKLFSMMVMVMVAVAASQSFDHSAVIRI
jgi:hypothetical protein